jgi:glycosyltransferase involved in cell wall biosynthesis
VIVYRDFSPNDPGLRSLYHRCEATAAGLPVVTTNVGGIPEIVENGTASYVIPPHDGIALRAAIAQLVADESRRTAMGAATNRFDAAQNTQRLLHLLREVAGRPQCGAFRRTW